MGAVRRRDAALMGALLLAGCASMPGKENVKGFADALRDATEKFEAAVSQLAEIERDQGLEDANRRYVAPPRPGEPFAPALPSQASPNADAARRALGDTLRVPAAYAANLTALTDGTELTAAQAAVTAAATQAAATLKQGKVVSEADAARGAGIVSGIANAVIEQRTAAAVTAAVRRAHPDIEALSDFLKTKIIGEDGRLMAGAAERNADGAAGFLALSLGSIRADRGVNAWQRDQAFRAAAQSNRRYRAARGIPAATRAALDKMVKAHAALLDPETAGPSIQEFMRAVNLVSDLFKAATPAHAAAS